MKSVWGILLAAAVLAVPVSAATGDSQTSKTNAARFCKGLRADMGVTPFKQAYGTNANRSNAFGKCVAKNAKALSEIHTTAVKQCKADGAKPLGKCVSAQEKQDKAEHHDAIVNASKQCRTERAQDPEAFKEKYGTNRNKRNAFGKCVSKLARENEQENQS